MSVYNERDLDGAVDFDACPGKHLRACRCGACRVCGFSKHTAIHGPLLGQPPNSRPFGHKFQDMKPGVTDA